MNTKLNNKRRPMIKLVLLLLAIIVVLASGYGWRPSKSHAIKLSESEKQSAYQLRKMVEYLADNVGVRNYMYEDNLKRAADYIERQFKDLGYNVHNQTYEAKGQTFRNIIAELPGKSDKILIVGAHYDSCFNPGADDNASGIAGLIEMARLLKDKKFKSTIRFVAFTNEEPPFFMTEAMGSRMYAKKLKEDAEDISGAVVLEMIGYYSEAKNSQKYLPLLGPFYPNKGNFIAITGNIQSKRLVKELKANFKKSTDFPIVSLVAPSFVPKLNYSDHWSFWQEGIPGVMVTDTAFLRNDHYHTDLDLPDDLDYQKMSVVVHGLAEAIAGLANS